VRAQIQASSESTALKWTVRQSVHDLSYRPHTLNTKLNPAQEAIVVELRRLLLLPLDDLLVITREFNLSPDVARGFAALFAPPL
jgi:hypothetical protein